MDLLEAAPAFVCCSELGRFTFRGTDLFISSCRESIGISLFVHCREVIPISESPFREVPLHIHICRRKK